MKQEEYLVYSSLDGTMQPSLFYKAQSSEKRPLLVGLHTWSYNRFNQIDNLLPYAEKYDFHLLLPEFRGDNLLSNPNCKQACGSEYAKQDIKDAIDHVVKAEAVDPENIFLLGLSGGGQMALLMSGFCPEYFKAVGAFVPITDLRKWSVESPKYRDHILACCSNDEAEMMMRSPVTYLDIIAKANVKIFHGKHDDIVPVNHSISFFYQMMDQHPTASVYLDIFDGGHEIDMELAMHWLLSQYGTVKKAEVTG